MSGTIQVPATSSLDTFLAEDAGIFDPIIKFAGFAFTPGKPYTMQQVTDRLTGREHPGTPCRAAAFARHDPPRQAGAPQARHPAGNTQQGDTNAAGIKNLS